MISRSPVHTETFLLIVMGTEFPIKRYLNDFGVARLNMFVFVCVCVYVCILWSLCTRALEEFCILSLARKTEENKHCLYYSNEYALGSKLYNFPLTPTLKMPRMAQGNLWHLTLLAPNTVVLCYRLTADPSLLDTHNSITHSHTSLTLSLIAASANQAIWIQQSLISTWFNIVTLGLGLTHQWSQWRICTCKVHVQYMYSTCRHTCTATEIPQMTDAKTSAAVQMLFVPIQHTRRVLRAKLITLRSHWLTLASSNVHSEERLRAT